MAGKKEIIELVESKEMLSSSWKEKLAKYAEEAKKFAANSGNGLPFFSLSNRTLKWHGEKIKYNILICIILSQRFEHTYYTSKYDFDKPVAPVCFSIGSELSSMVPHENSSEKQNETCEGCPQNEWASSTILDSKAKACSNVIRIALLPAGTYIKDDNPKLMTKVKDFEKEEIGYLRIPVTSTKNFTKLIKMAPLGLPPFAFYSKIEVVEDEKTQFKLVFSAIKPILNPELLTILEQRLNESEEEIDTPYEKAQQEEEVDEKEEAKKRKF